MSTHEITFWELLSDSKVEIPIIQRDYAQGRSGKEELRKSFLRNLKETLDKNVPMKLDFVYGTKKEDLFVPLDGQQRLTTLWLLHWYLASRAGKLAEASTRLKKFSYETRSSSRQFCERLAEFDISSWSKGDSLREYIMDQRWFHRAWRNDPTVQSMLRMLEGELEDKMDGIAGVFKEKPTDYYEKLTGTKCPIVFNRLDLPNIAHPDDLYIKMNARGKQLTSFENFKADLTEYIKTEYIKGEEVDALKDPKNGLYVKLDTDWMDVFWQNRSSDNAVDEIYFAFITRYFLNSYVVQLNGDLPEGKDRIFDFLYGRNPLKDKTSSNVSSGGKNEKVENERIAYLGFDVFREVLGSDSRLLARFYHTLNNFSEFQSRKDLGKEESLFESPWKNESNSKDKFGFAPCYTGGEQDDFAGNPIRAIAPITQPQRVVFHAICKFFEHGWNAGNANDKLQALKDWMRVVWNIVENAKVDTIEGMIGCLKLIDELAKSSHNILGELSSDNFSLESGFAREQIEEEKQKARKIIENRNCYELIREAEKHPVFRGAIRCLYMGQEEGKIAWDTFQKKWKNAQDYFKTLEKDKIYGYLRWFVANCTTSNELKSITYDVGRNTWKKNLLEKDLCKVVDRFLMNPAPVTIKPVEPFQVEEQQYKHAREDLCTPGFLAGLSYDGGHVDGCRLREAYGQLALFPNNAKSERKKYVIANKRNSLLAELGDDIRTEQKLSGCNYYWGWDVDFGYNSHTFQWNRDNKVYLMDENNQYVRISQGGYLCFDIDESESTATFKGKLADLIAKKPRRS